MRHSWAETDAHPTVTAKLSAASIFLTRDDMTCPRPGGIQAQPEVEGKSVRAKAARVGLALRLQPSGSHVSSRAIVFRTSRMPRGSKVAR
jgi:hypothetical protein